MTKNNFPQNERHETTNSRIIEPKLDKLNKKTNIIKLLKTKDKENLK